MSFLRWLVVCQGGRKCGRPDAIPVDFQPRNVNIVVQYRCVACQTTYRRINNGKPKKVRDEVPFVQDD